MKKGFMCIHFIAIAFALTTLSSSAGQISDSTSSNSFPYLLDWQYERNGLVKWAKDCNFNGNNIDEFRNVREEDCGGLCLADQICTHFSWLDETCFLKEIKRRQPKMSCEESGRCGLITNRQPILTGPLETTSSRTTTNTGSTVTSMPSTVAESASTDAVWTTRGKKKRATLKKNRFRTTDMEDETTTEEGGTEMRQDPRTNDGNIIVGELIKQNTPRTASVSTTKGDSTTPALETSTTRPTSSATTPSTSLPVTRKETIGTKNEKSISPLLLEWNVDHNGLVKWAKFCDFLGLVTYDEKDDVPEEECGKVCLADTSCTHFSWIGGLCVLKEFSNKRSSKEIRIKEVARCGFIVNRSYPISAITTVASTPSTTMTQSTTSTLTSSTTGSEGNKSIENWLPTSSASKIIAVPTDLKNTSVKNSSYYNLTNLVYTSRKNGKFLSRGFFAGTSVDE